MLGWKTTFGTMRSWFKIDTTMYGSRSVGDQGMYYGIRGRVEPEDKIWCSDSLLTFIERYV